MTPVSIGRNGPMGRESRRRKWARGFLCGQKDTGVNAGRDRGGNMIKSRNRIASILWLCTTSSAALLAGQAIAQEPAAEEEEAKDEIVVTGFRASLNQALNDKRDSIAAVDSIVAEDIAKFPDQNIAESLQRIPGIAILRDGGEGRAITVRGLGAQFTRVRVNGMETVATSTDGASANRDRAFDFNVFASELFSGIVVHKTAEASLDEGSLGAVVDLNTGNPLAGKEGLTGVASAQLQYNTLRDQGGPRLAGLLSFKDPSGEFGASVSAAYAKYDTFELGNNTVRWQQARFDSVGGVSCFTAPNTGGSYVSSTNCNAVALAFHPRIPRYGEIEHRRERLGLTGSVQWEPTESTKISIDGLYSSFKEDREEKWGEALLRGLERQVDVAGFSIDGNNNLISATLNDVQVRTEHYLRQSETEYYQLGATVDQDITDTFRVHFLGGWSKSDADIPLETTIIFDDKNAQNYRYDYTDMEYPVLTFGTDPTNPANFQLSEIRDRPSKVTNKFETVSLGGEWDALENLTVKAGGVYRKFGFQTIAYARDTVVCPAAGTDRVLGTLTCSATTNISDSAIYGYPVNSTLGDVFTLKNAGAPAGTSTQWLIPNLPATTAFTNLYSRTPALDNGNIRQVVEKVMGGYFELTGETEILGHRVRGDAGVRYVNTDQASTGIQVSGANIGPVTIERSYDDWLPSGNIAIDLTDELVLRAAAAKVMTRPTLGNLTPGGTIDGFNYRVSFGNPFLEPFRANAYDVALEWYFAKGSILSVAYFRKDVSSFTVASTRTGTFASTGLPVSAILASSPAAANPEGQPWAITTILNGEGATLNGFEAAMQLPFTFLPGCWSNFGALANATFITSDADYTIAGPAITPGGALVTTTVNNTLLGLSKRAFNATLYYEDTKFSARASGSYRSRFVDGTSATGNFFEGYNNSFNLDANVKYKLSDQLEFSIEGINLTDDYRSRFTDVNADRNYENHHFGRTLMLGARYKL